LGIKCAFHGMLPPIVVEETETCENELREKEWIGEGEGVSPGEAIATSELQHILLRRTAKVKAVEIMNLRWSDYDAAKKEINIVSSDSYRVKGGKMRTIPLVGNASSILDRKKRISEWIFGASLP